jgi:hypothetical protein
VVTDHDTNGRCIVIHTVSTIVESRFLDPIVAATVAETSRNVWSDAGFGGQFVASTMTVDAFVNEVVAATPDPEAARQVHIARIKMRNAQRDQENGL